MIDYNKLIESIHYIVSKSSSSTSKANQYNVLKALYFADKWSWVKRKKTIARETYYAMEKGPVPSLAYALVKGEAPFPQQEVFNQKIQVKKSPSKGGGTDRDLFSKELFVQQFLSDEDIALLKDSAENCLSLSYDELRDASHEESAWQCAWDDKDPKDKRHNMDFENISDTEYFPIPNGNIKDLLKQRYPDCSPEFIDKILQTKKDNPELPLSFIKDMLLALEEESEPFDINAL